MTVKIIREGKRPVDKTMMGICTECRTEIECLESDAIKREIPKMTYVGCPTCTHRIHVMYKPREICWEEGNRG